MRIQYAPAPGRSRGQHPSVFGPVVRVKILVLNAGSSTLKFSLIEAETERALGEGVIDWSRDPARLRVNRPGQPATSADITLRDHGEAVVRALDELTRGE